MSSAAEVEEDIDEVALAEETDLALAEGVGLDADDDDLENPDPTLDPTVAIPVNKDDVMFSKIYPDCSEKVMSEKNEKRMMAVWYVWFAFAHSMGRDPLGDIGLALWPDLDKDYSAVIISAFFVRMMELGLGKSLIERAIVWMNANLKAEYLCRARRMGRHTARAPQPDVGRLKAAQDAGNAALARKARQDEEDDVDIQADEHNFISIEQQYELIDCGLCIGEPSDGLYHTSALMKLNFLASYFTQCQICRRGEDLYEATMNQRYVKLIETLGPRPGTVCNYLVARRSKRNLGRKKQTANYAPHCDPLRDGAFYHGLLWMHRGFDLNEWGRFLLPDHTDYKRLALIALYRKVGDLTRLGSGGFQYIWKKFFVHCPDVDVRKVTHQCKGQGIREMKDARIDTDDIAHYVNQRTKSVEETDVLLTCYMTNLPVVCTAQRAGSHTPKEPQFHDPAYARIPVPDEVLMEHPSLRQLLEQRDSIHAQFKASRTRKERMEQRLYTAVGAVDAMVHDIKRVFQVMAARPVDPKTYAVLDSPPIRDIEKYRFGVFQSIFELPVFYTDAFEAYRTAVRAAESFDADYVELAAHHPVRNLVERSIATHFRPSMDNMNRQMHSVNTKLAMFEQLLMARNGHQVMPPPAPSQPQQHPVFPPGYHPVIPVAMPLEAAMDTTRNNDTRKRRRCISEAQRLLAEPASQRRRVQFTSFPLKNMSDLERLVNEYNTVWKHNEAQEGCSWRTDEPFDVTTTSNASHAGAAHGTVTNSAANEKTMGDSNARCVWWGARLPIFEVFDALLKHSNAEVALEGIRFIYNQIPTSATGSRPVDVVLAQFKATRAKVFGGSKPKGRPPKNPPPEKIQENFVEEIILAATSASSNVAALSEAVGAVTVTHDNTAVRVGGVSATTTIVGATIAATPHQTTVSPRRITVTNNRTAHARAPATRRVVHATHAGNTVATLPFPPQVNTNARSTVDGLESPSRARMPTEYNGIIGQRPQLLRGDTQDGVSNNSRLGLCGRHPFDVNGGGRSYQENDGSTTIVRNGGDPWNESIGQETRRYSRGDGGARNNVGRDSRFNTGRGNTFEAGDGDYHFPALGGGDSFEAITGGYSLQNTDGTTRFHDDGSWNATGTEDLLPRAVAVTRPPMPRPPVLGNHTELQGNHTEPATNAHGIGAGHNYASPMRRDGDPGAASDDGCWNEGDSVWGGWDNYLASLDQQDDNDDDAAANEPDDGQTFFGSHEPPPRRYRPGRNINATPPRDYPPEVMQQWNQWYYQPMTAEERRRVLHANLTVEEIARMEADSTRRRKNAREAQIERQRQERSRVEVLQHNVLLRQLQQPNLRPFIGRQEQRNNSLRTLVRR